MPIEEVAATEEAELGLVMWLVERGAFINDVPLLAPSTVPGWGDRSAASVEC
jgi:hypothetical protein